MQGEKKKTADCGTVFGGNGMENILSYLKWRGDISFEERPFCEVDNLILSELAYLDLKVSFPLWKAGRRYR